MKRFIKRIVSVVLVIAVLIAFLPAMTGKNSYFAAESEGEVPPQASNTGSTGSSSVLISQELNLVRGVVNGKEDVKWLFDQDQFTWPKSGGNSSAALGTPQNPFLVLEIVPYAEYAEFGYLIGGCEPVDIYSIPDASVSGGNSNTVNLKDILDDYLGTATVENELTKKCYFEDEIDYAYFYNRFGNYIDTDTVGEVVYGYYEKVENPGSGNFTFSFTNNANMNGVGNTRSGEEAVFDPVPDENSGMNADDEESNIGDAGSYEGGTGSDVSDEEANVSDDGLNANGGDTNAGDVGSNVNDEDTNVGDVGSNANDGDTNAGDMGLDVDNERSNVSGTGLNVVGEESNADGGVVYGANSVSDNDALTTGTGSGNVESATDSDGTISNDNDIVSEPANDTTMAQTESTNDIPIVQILSASGGDADPFDLTLTYDKSGGLWQWHTITRDEGVFDKYLEEEAARTGDQDLKWYDLKNLTSDGVGEVYERYTANNKIYASRTTGDNAQKFLLMDNYRSYKNRELFLKNSLGLSDDEAANYSIVIKTITPAELNGDTNFEWIKRANLIYLSATGHRTEMNKQTPLTEPEEMNVALMEMWREYGWFNEVGLASSHEKNFYENNDLTWETAYELYKKVTGMNGVTDFAGLIIDDSIYDLDPSSGFYKGATVKDKISVNVYDWNLNPVKDSSVPGKDYTIDITGCNNNIYKLAVMLQAMDSNLFKSIYLTDDPNGKGSSTGQAIQTKPYVDTVSKGINSWQYNDAQDYWSVESFLLMNPYISTGKYGSMLNISGNATGNYDNCDYWWNNYHSVLDPTNKRYQYKANGHVFIRSDEKGIVLDYKEDIESIESGETGGSGLASVMGEILAEPDVQPKDITVLDLEPFGESATLTKSYAHMLIPFYRGEINIDHQTTAEFIGRSEEPVVEYQMIYLGVDYSGLGSGESEANAIGAYLNEDGFPAWKNGNTDEDDTDEDDEDEDDEDKDESMNGLIYSHTGGMETISDNENVGPINNGGIPYYEKRSASFYNRNGIYVKTTELRYPGNDISYRKFEELMAYLAANRPIVAECYLYDLNTTNIDEKSHIYKLVSAAKANNDNDKKVLFNTLEAKAVSSAVLNIPQNVTFTECPKDYSLKEGYLDYRSGRAYLDFAYTVNGEIDGYMYKIYIDRDGDSEFEDNAVGYPELVDKGALPPDGIHFPIPSDMVGIVHWKIMVYKNDSDGRLVEQYVKTGFSALNNRTVEEIKVLQILPDKDELNKLTGVLNLYKEVTDTPSEEKQNIAYYCQKIEDDFGYKINVTSVTLNDYLGYFSDKFSYSYDVVDEKIVTKVGDGDLGKLGGDLMDYNMIIVGSAIKDISNSTGAVDFLWYWADLGRSIIFLRDLTSMGYQESFNNDGTNSWFGTNNWLRDLMGMDRYQSYGWYLEGPYGINGKEKDTLKYYWKTLEKQGDTENAYDWLKPTTESENVGKGTLFAAEQGYNYFTVLQLANEGTNDLTYLKEKNYLTEKVTQVNKGQISFYPLEIGEDDDGQVDVSSTHAQYFQLNPEDKDVTVWYCLAGENIYGDSPNDAMNNYYIYSKANIFYSGIGHSSYLSNDEKKLFLNMMIAAYNASIKQPFVVIENVDAEPDNSRMYEIRLLQDYYNWSDTKNVYEDIEGASEDENGNYVPPQQEFVGGSMYSIDFTPIVSAQDGLNSKLYLAMDFTHIEIGDEPPFELGGAAGVNFWVLGGDSYLESERSDKFEYILGDAGFDVFTLDKNKTYTLKFNKNIDIKREKPEDYLLIRFYLWNDNSKQAEITEAYIYYQPLFLLD